MKFLQPCALMPTDYSSLVPMIYVAFAVGTLVTFFVALLATRGMQNRFLRTFLRVLPISLVWSFSPCGTRGDWWPAPLGLLFGVGWQRLYALAAMAVGTLVAFAVCALGMLAARSPKA